MSDIEHIHNAGICSAIIVDDGYDEAPKVEELLTEDGWDTFFDDVYGDVVNQIEAIFPAYDPDDREALKSNQEFVDALWQHRDTIKDTLGDLFETYEQKIQENRAYLETVETTLEELEISFERCGRDFVEAAIKADLIVIDLFLGIQQGEQDRKFTVERLKEVLKKRGEISLPSIVLMSQVPGIDELAKEFRENVKLHASAFRHIRKTDLSKAGRIKGLILTLASHRSDSQSLATFVETWEDKAIEAVRSAANTLRKIDIDDLQHIRSMLLRFEGLNTSSYMLDVFDRVLQYEIESHNAVLEAAIPLDEMADDPAPLMISNDRDTYAVLEQTLFVNPKRRAHTTGAEWPIMFGDILGPKPEKNRGSFLGREDQVFFVASPECDLIRSDGLTSALLMTGSVKEIDTTRPDLAVTGKTTPIISLDEEKRFQVNWDFGNLRTINLDQARRMIHEESGVMKIIARLRQGSALNLRQQLLTNIGRVGELAPLPRSLRFRADLYIPLEGGEVQPLKMSEGVAIEGNIIIPRRGKYAAAIIDSNCEDDLTAVLLDLDLKQVAPKSRNIFIKLSEQTRIRQIFRSGFQGIELPLIKPKTAGLLNLDKKQPETDGKKPVTDIVALIVQGGVAIEELSKKDTEKAGLIIKIHEEPDV